MENQLVSMFSVTTYCVNIIREENVQLVNSDEEPLMDAAANYSSDEFDSDDDNECD